MRIYIFFIALMLIGGCSKQISRQPRPLRPSMTDTVSELAVTVFQEKFDSLGNIAYDVIPSPGAQVSLYISETDLKNDTNQVGKTLITDSNGIVIFKNLYPQTYFIKAATNCQNNLQGLTMGQYISTGSPLTAGMTRSVETYMHMWANIKFRNNSGNPCSVILQMKSYDPTFTGPTYKFDLKNTDSLTFQQLTTGVYLITVTKPNVADVESSVNLKGCSDEMIYTIH